MNKNKITNNTVVSGTIYDLWIVILNTMLLICLFTFITGPNALSILIGFVITIILLIHFIWATWANVRYWLNTKSFKKNMTFKNEGIPSFVDPLYCNKISMIFMPIYWILSRIIIPYLLVNLGLSGYPMSICVLLLVVFLVISIAFNFVRRSGINSAIFFMAR